MNKSKLRVVAQCADADEMNVSHVRSLPTSPMPTAARPPMRLSRRVITVDGHDVGVATAGRGVPLVMVHGFGVESMLYAQTLARTAALGFRVVALDIAGHGESASIGLWPHLDDYVDVLDRAIDQLGIRRAVFMGHSMGGRIVTELCARRPDRAIAVVLLDPIAGGPWDAMRPWLRWCPPALGLYGVGGFIDVMSTLPAFVDARQAIKIGRQVRRSIVSLVTEPWNGLVAGAAVLRSRPSVDTLTSVHAARIPAIVMQGDHDLLVPEAAAIDTATRLDATYVSVKGGRHSWMVRDPEALPSIVEILLEGSLGAALTHEGLCHTMTLAQRWTHCTDATATVHHDDDLDVILNSQRTTPRLAFTIN